MSNKLLPEHYTLLKLDYLLAKQDIRTVPVAREDAADDPRAEQFQIEERAPAETSTEHPGEKGKVQTKIYELVHRGGRTFERARTAWVNPSVATRLNQRKVATDWIRTLGNYIPIYFVGGYIRDKYFKKVSKDVDIIALVPLEEAKKIFDNLGIQYTETSNAFARLKFYVGDLKVDMISTTREGLYDNLRQRDFTVNSIAQSVTGQFYDPFHGLDDIKAKILRTPANRSLDSFKEDPSRILRAARFISELPVKPHQSLSSAMPEASKEFQRLKADRIGWELAKILQAEKPWKGLSFLSSYGLIKHICPDLANLKGLKQSGRRKDVFHHSLRSMQMAKSEDLILNLALLFHDLGKGIVEKVGGNFPGHAKPGAIAAEKTLKRLGFNKSVVSRVSNLIANHKFVDEMKDDFDVDEAKKLVLELRGDLDRFFELCHADAKAGSGGADDVKKVEKMVRNLKSTLPNEAGEDDESEIQKLDEVPHQEKNSKELLKSDKIMTDSVLDVIDESMLFMMSEKYSLISDIDSLIDLADDRS